MVGFLLSAAVAALLGFLAGMGIGGGSLLLLWLTQVEKLAQPQAKIISLLFFLPAAFISTMFRKKQKQLEPESTLPAIIAGCTAAAALCLLSKNWNTDAMKKLLGGLLILTGIREIFYRPRNAR